MIKLDKNLSLLHCSYSHKKKNLPLFSTLNSQQTLLNKDAGSATSTSSFKHCFLNWLPFCVPTYTLPSWLPSSQPSPFLPSSRVCTLPPPSSQHFLFSWLLWHHVLLVSLQNNWLLFLRFFCQILLPLLKLNVQKNRHLFPLCISALDITWHPMALKDIHVLMAAKVVFPAWTNPLPSSKFVFWQLYSNV